MIKSLYLKIVLLFFAAVAIGLGSAIPLTAYLFKDQITQSVQREYAVRTGLISKAFSRLAPTERAPFLKELSENQKISLWVYDRNGLRYAYGQASKTNLTDEDIRRIQGGA